MGKCSCHSEIETSYLCMKHNVYLCEECLECRDPDIYCKFRSSCPIWFMQKKGIEGWSGGDEEAPDEKQAYKVVFLSDNKEVRVSEGSTLLKAANLANVYLNASCNGKGACGKCKLVVESGDVEKKTTPLLTDGEKERNYVLACQSRVKGDVTVRIPEEALDSIGADTVQVKNIVLSGNTTMSHLLLQIEPRYIRREPYIPTVSGFPILKAGEIGLKANPIAAVFVMPGPAGYVGGDIVSGLLHTGFHREEPLTLFIDVGTNGEIVLGNKDWLMTAACSAGPAFEGGGIRWGMRAEEGAIEKISIDPETLEPEFSTVGDEPPGGFAARG